MGGEGYQVGVEITDKEMTFKDCGYYKQVEWKMKYACFHSNEFAWCEGCLRVTGVERLERKAVEAYEKRCL